MKYFVNNCKIDPQTPREDGWTPLMSAANGGHLEIIKYFVIERKVDSHTVKKNGWNALMSASEKGNLEVVKFFVEECVILIQLPKQMMGKLP